MCGIAGVVVKGAGFDPEALSQAVHGMIAQIHHRGPDAGGVKVVGPVGLGHRRLAIIDLNERSAQPMMVENGKVWIVFNGEIYNYLELKAELLAKGCTFRTASDTEVILQGWRIWGEAMVSRLRGMFAFALWDAEAHTMLLARDRFGKKPLFYSNTAGWFLFASEIKSILEWPGFERRVNLGMIHDYLSYRYCIGDGSAFAGIRKIPPAHYMVLESGKPNRLERYWRQAPVDPANEKRSIDDLAHELIERLDETIRLRMIADVPLGAFLSGGVDSSAVVARMAVLSATPVKTFTVGFAIDGFDEKPFAREVAERYNTEHYEFTMDYGLIRELPKLVWHYGEPYADSSALVTFALSREIRRFVTVALSGDGGDEIFLGYSRYGRFRNMVQDWNAGVRQPLPYASMIGEEHGLRIRDRYIRSISTFREEHKIAGYGANLVDFLFMPAADRLGLGMEGAVADDAMDVAARMEVETYLPDDLLVKADIATMAVALEGRSPFLDHELSDWASSLPQSKRVFERHGELQLKGLLKYALEPYLPHQTMYRRKQGFAVPVAHWMKHEIKDFMIDLLTSQRFRERGLITPRFIDHMMQRHFSGREDHGTRLWTLLNLELWFQTFIDRAAPGPLTVDVTAHGSAEGLRLAG